MTLLDENTRRYYLETMGIQCWQLHADEQQLQDEREDLVSEAGIIESPVINTPVKKDQGGDMQASEAADWQQLHTAVEQCESCALYRNRTQAVVNVDTGDISASLMFVVLSPDDHGQLLTTGAKALFEKMLAAIGLSLDEIYLTSMLKCPVPPNHTVSAKEILSCQQHLQQQVQLVKPKSLVVLGDTAARCLLQKNLSLDDLRDGYNLKKSIQEQFAVGGVPLFVSYSPEELLNHPENKRKAWTDLQQLQKISDS